MTSRLRRQPSSWFWLLTLFTVGSFIETASFSHVTAFMPLYLPHLGVLEANVPEWTGRIVAVSSAVGIPFMPVWGALADRYARRPVIVRSFVVHLIALILMLLAGNLWVFVFGRAVMSLTFGNSGLMMATLSERVPERRVGLAFAIMAGALPLGGLAGPLLGGPIVDAWGLPTLLAFDSVFVLAVTLAMTFGYRDTFHAVDHRPLVKMTADSVLIIWRSPYLRTLFAALFLLTVGWALGRIYVPLAIMALYQGDQPATVVGLVLGAGALTTVVFTPAMGAAADRYGLWRMLFAGVVVEAILWSTPALANGLVGFTVAWALLGGVVSGVTAISFAVLSGSASSDIRGRVMSLSTLPMIAGSMVGPAIGSVVTQGSVFTVFPVAAGMTTLGIGVLVLARRRALEKGAAAG